jgi:8-oxo-dGTP pyrophosphatase MutT (NUDIX family)
MTEPAPEARAAATAILFRERAEGAPEILFMERSGTMAFAAGALVFPGGAIDAHDLDHAAALGYALPLEEAASRIGAIRETLEESGLTIGFREPPDRATAETLRAGLHAGTAFSKLLAEAGLELDLEALVPFARWRPTLKEKTTRIFDTRFYLAQMGEGSHEPSADTTENVHLFWAGAQDILDRSARGEAKVIFPTRRNLERLAQFASFDAAVADTRMHPVVRISPWIEDRDGCPSLCIPENMGYPVTHEPLEYALRG